MRISEYEIKHVGLKADQNRTSESYMRHVELKSDPSPTLCLLKRYHGTYWRKRPTNLFLSRRPSERTAKCMQQELVYIAVLLLL